MASGDAEELLRQTKMREEGPVVRAWTVRGGEKAIICHQLEVWRCHYR